ncbi:retinoid-inducible serine carboxypeptidase-like [Anopheles bellator]|uniref:retinoid-inducible serine carboxypeptidase-like n=1 Tax=Anopheles bellator TaxID=139047 RepID=UPI002649CF87|nr:retinoid-inducible serine carboxypeptidase-like [Anopheles bellator]
MGENGDLFGVGVKASFPHSLAARHGFGPGRQDWGYSEVRPGAFMFWWLHYAGAGNQVDKPLLIWLQGGPGGSSTGYGNFEEIGPLDRSLNHRPHAWVNDYNVLFIDSPVGSGFSYVEDRSQLATNSTTVVQDLMRMLKDFYAQSVTYADWERHVPLYIASQSYGGRIAVELADGLVQAVRSGDMHCQLHALFLGNAWLSPIDSISAWPDYLHRMGYVGAEGAARIEQRVAAVREQQQHQSVPTEHQQQSVKAIDSWHSLQQAIIRETHGINCYNVLQPTGRQSLPATDEGSDELLEYGETVWWWNVEESASTPRQRLEQLMRGPVAHALGIADKPQPWGAQRNAVFEALATDFLRPTATAVLGRLMNETQLELVVYNGHLDLITCLPGTLRWVRRLLGEPLLREPFPRDSRDIQGYRTVYGNPRFTLYTVLRAGHMVPVDNPTAMAYILRAHT